MKRILIVGAGGQIGSELTVYLRKIYGTNNVVATDVRDCERLREQGRFEVWNALAPVAYASAVASNKIDTSSLSSRLLARRIPRWRGISIWAH